jgi:hypothetical protein
MAQLSRDEIRWLIGPVDDSVVAEIIVLGTTVQELAEGCCPT